jgi:hypothetical protein
MMKRILSYATVIIAALVFGHIAVGQTVTENATTPAATSSFGLDIKDWYFNENFQINTFKDSGSTLVGLNQTLGVSLTKDISVNLNVPVYTQDDNTTVSNIDLGANWADLVNGNNSLIGDWKIGVGGGIYIPVGSEYFRNANVNPYLNANFDCKIWELDFAQSVGYRFNGGESYITWLGAKTDSDVLSLTSDLSYKWNSFDFGAQFDQFYYVSNGEYQLFLGPVCKWNVASNVDIGMTVLLPVVQEVSTSEANAVVKAGIGIKF